VILERPAISFGDRLEQASGIRRAAEKMKSLDH
jgi:hypothetical protein